MLWDVCGASRESRLSGGALIKSMVDIVLGIVGAVVGGFVFGLLGISTSGLVGSFITATVGAIVMLLLVRLIKKA